MSHEFSVAQKVEKAFVGKPLRYRAICSCGWVGEDRRQKRDAEGDGFAHQAVVQPSEAA